MSQCPRARPDSRARAIDHADAGAFAAHVSCAKNIDTRRRVDAAIGRREPMKAKWTWFAGAALMSGSFLFSPALGAQSGAAPQAKPMKIHRLYTGPDGQTHA